MKKLRLKLQRSGNIEILKREQLKKIIGGDSGSISCAFSSAIIECYSGGDCGEDYTCEYLNSSIWCTKCVHKLT